MCKSETRFQIIRTLLCNKRMDVMSLCNALGVTQPNISHHLAFMRKEGFVKSRKKGKNRIYSLARADNLLDMIHSLFRVLANAPVAQYSSPQAVGTPPAPEAYKQKNRAKGIEARLAGINGYAHRQLDECFHAAWEKAWSSSNCRIVRQWINNGTSDAMCKKWVKESIQEMLHATPHVDGDNLHVQSTCDHGPIPQLQRI